jgi:hypothetical protein
VEQLLQAAQLAVTEGGAFSPGQAARLALTVEAVRAARNKRRAGGSVGGAGAGETAFERGQAKYANAAISIRKAVGSATGTDGRGESCTRNYVP